MLSYFASSLSSECKARGQGVWTNRLTTTAALRYITFESTGGWRNDRADCWRTRLIYDLMSNRHLLLLLLLLELIIIIKYDIHIAP